jgi:hypothetical protein
MPMELYFTWTRERESLFRTPGLECRRAENRLSLADVPWNNAGADKVSLHQENPQEGAAAARKTAGANRLRPLLVSGRVAHRPPARRLRKGLTPLSRHPLP